MRLGTYYRYLVIPKLKLPLSGETVLDVGCHEGFLSETFDVGGLIKVVDELLENDDKKEEVGINRTLTLDNYSWETVAERHLEEFEYEAITGELRL